MRCSTRWPRSSIRPASDGEGYTGRRRCRPTTNSGSSSTPRAPLADKQQAERLRREAESQLKLLTDTEDFAQSDFYSYRYFASEGFLPGYNFPRLPISAFIPARRSRTT